MHPFIDGRLAKTQVPRTGAWVSGYFIVFNECWFLRSGLAYYVNTCLCYVPLDVVHDVTVHVPD
jgi:hypothetical protein